MVVKDYSKCFSKLSKIDKVDERKIVYAKSGYSKLDKKIRGFIMGEVTVVSGLNGSGKSNWLLNEIINFAQLGYKTMLYSGEMQDFVIRNQLIRMILGINFLKQSEDNIFYFPKSEEDEEEAQKWLDDNFLLYNNAESNEAEDLIERIVYVAQQGYRIVVLDNLMTMDLRRYSSDKFEAQSVFIKRLAKLSKMLRIHIFIVMHPRKAMGFLRKDDISGSADLSNAVDNVLIVHRNNIDFEKRSKEIFGNRLETAGFYSYDNVIEVCKNRSYGVQDYFIGLYYETETKRFVEERGKNYGKVYAPTELPF